MAHYGAAIANSGADELLEFFLMAQIKGEIAALPGDDLYPQIVLRCRGQHAFAADREGRDTAREFLDALDAEPDDGAMVELLAGWREELYGALPDIPRKEGAQDSR